MAWWIVGGVWGLGLRATKAEGSQVPGSVWPAVVVVCGGWMEGRLEMGMWTRVWTGSLCVAASVTQIRHTSLLATKWLIERLGNRWASRAAGTAQGDAQSPCQRQSKQKKGLAYTGR